MAGISGTLTATLVGKLLSQTDGLNVRVGAIQQGDSGLQSLGIRSVTARNINADLNEKTGHAVYPAVLVYCDSLSNSLLEKFRQFSGSAHLIAEVRHSNDLLDQMETELEVYVDAICALLDDSRGDWGGGALYSGGYEVSYDPITRGGKNFLQRAKVGFQVEISK